MTASNYLNLFLDAGISRDQEIYSRCLDAVLAKEASATHHHGTQRRG
jgi:hypothetical protein